MLRAEENREARATGILLIKKENILEHHIKIGDIHANRLQHAVKKVHKKSSSIPGFFHNLSLDDIEPLDMMSTRYNKLQDLIGSKIFPLILELTGNDCISLIDKLNMLEKLGYLNDTNWWMSLRTLRNKITHEYADDEFLIEDTIKETLHESLRLLDYWHVLKPKLSSLHG